MVNDNDFQKAKNYAYRLLTFRPRTRHEMVMKLRQKKIQPDNINQLLNMLEELNLINDKAFAESFIQQKSNYKPMGKMGLSFQLRKYGISDSIINELLNDFSFEFEYSLALKTVTKFLSKHRSDNKQQTTNKLVSLLQRRGFDFEVINRVLIDVNFQET